MNRFGIYVLGALTGLLSTAAHGQVSVASPWVRGTVAGQKATGAFMQLKSAGDSTLVGAESPVAGIVEIHEMRLENNVMKMRPIQRLELPSGKAVELKPGGYHVMLMDLKKPLANGEKVPLTLRLEGRDRKTQTVEVIAEVRGLGAGSADAAAKHGH